MADHYDWRSKDGRIYTRALHAYEIWFALFSIPRWGNGSNPLVGVQISGLKEKSLPDDALTRLIRAAWIKARFDIPQLGLHTDKVPGGVDYDPATSHMIYEAGPAEVVDAWADRTIIFHQTSSSNAIESITKAALAKEWPIVPEGHDLIRLHLARDQSNTTFLYLHGAHVAFDIKGCFLVLDHLIKITTRLIDTMDSPAVLQPSGVYAWGEEPRRLALPMVMAAGAANADGMPFPGEQEIVQKIVQGVAQYMQNIEPVSFFPTRKASETESEPILTVHAVQLSAAETSTYRRVAKQHGLTVTELFSGIFAVAQYRFGIYLDNKQATQQPGAIAVSKNLLHYCPVDHRDHLLVPADAPFYCGVATSGPALVFSLETLGSISLPEVLPSEGYTLPETFWSQVCATSQATMQTLKSTRHETMISTHSLVQALMGMFQKGEGGVFSSQSVLSSIGDMDGFLQQSHTSPSGQYTVTVDDITARARIFPLFPMVWSSLLTFKGKLRFEILTMEAYYDPEDVEVLRTDVERLLKSVITSK